MEGNCIGSVLWMLTECLDLTISWPQHASKQWSSGRYVRLGYRKKDDMGPVVRRVGVWEGIEKILSII